MGDSLAPQSTQFCPAEQRANAGGEGERLAAELQVYLELATIRDKLKVCIKVLRLDLALASQPYFLRVVRMGGKIRETTITWIGPYQYGV